MRVSMRRRNSILHSGQPARLFTALDSVALRLEQTTLQISKIKKGNSVSSSLRYSAPYYRGAAPVFASNGKSDVRRLVRFRSLGTLSGRICARQMFP